MNENQFNEFDNARISKAQSGLMLRCSEEENMKIRKFMKDKFRMDNICVK